MTNKYDVIIIGAGIGGLTAGAILARNGKKVLVLEKNPVVGGYAVNFKRKGFEFDASLHMMQGCNKGGMTYNILKECGIIEKMRFIKPESLYRAFYPSLEIKIDQENPAAFIEKMKKAFPKEKKGIDSLVQDTRDALVAFKEFREYKRISNKIKFYLSKTCSEICNLFIQDPKLISIFSQLWGYFGLPPSKLSAYYLPFLLYDYTYNGGYYPEGGAGGISNSLCGIISQNKGEILLNSEVKKIIVKDDKVNSIVTKDGKEFFADSIISNIDARHTFLDLIGYKFLPNNFTEDLEIMEPSISAFQVYLGLDINLHKLGIQDYEIFVNPDFDFDNHYELVIKNEMEKVPFSITLYSNIGRNMWDSDKTTIALATLAGYDYWHRFSIKDYKNMKYRLAEIFIKRAETLIPNLKSYIKTMDVATPLTMERYTGNYKGAIYGWANSVLQCGPRRSFINTPFRNLHLASAWTHPGGGVSGVLYAGELAAKRIIENFSFKRE